MKEAELVNKIIEWGGYLHPFSTINPVELISALGRYLLWHLISGLAYIQDAVNGLSVKALALLNIQNYPEFQAFMTKYMPLVVALAVIFMLVTLIGMMVNKGKDTSLFDFFKNLLISMIVLIGFPFIWGQATKNTTDIAKYINQSSSMSTSVIAQNVTDLYYVDKHYGFDVSQFNSKEDGKDKAGLALDKTKNFLPQDKSGNIKVSDLARIDPNEVIDTGDPAIKLSKDGKKILSHKIQWGEDSASSKKLGDGVFGVGKEHYYRYKFNTFRILFYQVLAIAASSILTWKVGQICLEIWFGGFFVQATALFDLKTGRKLLAVSQKFFVSLFAVLVIFVMATFFNIGYAFIDSSIATSNLSGFILNCLLKLVLLFAIIDGPNVFESVFGVDAGLKSATRSIIAMNQGSQLIGSGMNKLKGAGGAVARGVGKAGGAAFGAKENFSGEKSSEAESDAMNGIGSEEAPDKENMKETSAENNEKTAGTSQEGNEATGNEALSQNLNEEAPFDGTPEFQSEGREQDNLHEESRTGITSEEPTADLEALRQEHLNNYARKASSNVRGVAVSKLQDNGEEAMQELDRVSLPRKVSETVAQREEEVNSKVRNLENAQDRYKGVKKSELKEVRQEMVDSLLSSEKHSKTMYSSVHKGMQSGKHATTVLGQSKTRRNARAELKEAKHNMKQLMEREDSRHENT